MSRALTVPPDDVLRARVREGWPAGDNLTEWWLACADCEVEETTVLDRNVPVGNGCVSP